VGSLGRHPAASAFQAGLRPINSRRKTAPRAGRRCQSAPCWTHQNYWAQSGPYWTSNNTPPICRGTNCENTTLGRDGHEVVTSNRSWLMSFTCSRRTRGPRRARAGMPLVSPWNRRSDRISSPPIGGFPRSRQKSGPRKCNPTHHKSSGRKYRRGFMFDSQSSHARLYRPRAAARC
jgi:hypothetical protein